nr:unnamed protein product [Haemonchus contortus]
MMSISFQSRTFFDRLIRYRCKTVAFEQVCTEVFNGNRDFLQLIAAEHRVRALIDAIQPAGGVNDVWSNSIEKMTEGSMVTSSTATNRAENPAGVIGSPVKGKGGAYACRHKASIDT